MTRLEAERLIRGMTQGELGTQVLYSRLWVGRLERGELRPNQLSPRLRKALEDYFGISVEELLRSAELQGPDPKEAA